ncbi:MAG: MmgE/PrpD family protein [Alphaproteobacteria bacterium]
MGRASDAAPATLITVLARWVAGLELRDIPAAVRYRAKRCLLDTVGVALAGSLAEVAAIVRGTAFADRASGAATVLGSERRLAAAGAALANATAAHALDFDDNCYAGIVHGSAVVAPAVLAMAESVGASGGDLLTAFIAGVEAEYAVGKCVTRALYDKGWFNTAVLGAIGAAAGAARILRLDQERTAQAIALATAGTGGLRASIGTLAKPYLAGRAAEAGVNAARHAAAGVTGPLAAFEDRRGFARLLNDGILESAALAGLGREWSLEVPGIDFKLYPVCLSSHAAVDAVAAILAENGLCNDDVEGIECEVPELVAVNLSYDRPSSVQEARFSLPFAVASILAFGALRLEHLSEAVLTDASFSTVMAKVAMRVSEGWNDDALRARDCPEGAMVTLRTRDGRVFKRFTGSARGTVVNPLDDDSLEAKFLDCARHVLPAASAEALLQRIRSVESLPRAADLFAGVSLRNA